MGASIEQRAVINSAVLDAGSVLSIGDFNKCVFQEDGSRLSSCINACSLALADAGIPMRGVVTCVTCSSVDGRPVVDISAREEMDTIPRLTVRLYLYCFIV